MYKHPYYKEAQEYVKSLGFDESELITKAFLAGVDARSRDLSDLENAVLTRYMETQPEMNLTDWIKDNVRFDDV